jgi:hypothetical protein
MDILKQLLMTENPEKYRDRDTGEERSVSGFSSLNYQQEMECMTCLIRATDILFRFAESDVSLLEDVFIITKDWLDITFVISIRIK